MVKIKICFNDSPDSDNLAAALQWFRIASQEPDTRLIWILEPRQVRFGLSMTDKEISSCRKLIQLHFPELENPFKVLLGGLLEQDRINEIKGLKASDRVLVSYTPPDVHPLRLC